MCLRVCVCVWFCVGVRLSLFVWFLLCCCFVVRMCIHLGCRWLSFACVCVCFCVLSLLCCIIACLLFASVFELRRVCSVLRHIGY